MAAFDLDDDTMREMASAWPQIATLVLKVSAVGYAGTNAPAWLAKERPRFTLTALAHLAHRCASLEALELTVDATVVPVAWEPCAQTALTALTLGHSPLTKTAISPVAAFIRTIFPALRSVSVAPKPPPVLTPYQGIVTYGNLHEKKWLAVSALLREGRD